MEVCGGRGGHWVGLVNVEVREGVVRRKEVAIRCMIGVVEKSSGKAVSTVIQHRYTEGFARRKVVFIVIEH